MYELLWFALGSVIAGAASSLYWNQVMLRENKHNQEQLIIMRARAMDLRSELDDHIERNYKRWEELCARLGVDPTLGKAPPARRGGGEA